MNHPVLPETLQIRRHDAPLVSVSLTPGPIRTRSFAGGGHPACGARTPRSTSATAAPTSRSPTPASRQRTSELDTKLAGSAASTASPTSSNTKPIRPDRQLLRTSTQTAPIDQNNTRPAVPHLLLIGTSALGVVLKKVRWVERVSVGPANRKRGRIRAQFLARSSGIATGALARPMDVVQPCGVGHGRVDCAGCSGGWGPPRPTTERAS